MTFVIITGMSGAGKSTAIKILEDIGFFCVDNLPADLIPKFAELCLNSTSEYNKVAIGIDIRSGKAFGQLFKELNKIDNNFIKVQILYLDASNEVLLKRFKETRRKHPLVDEGRISEGIEKERAILKEAKTKANATYILDTSNILARELREELHHIFLENEEYDSLIITVLSFGFKYGIPSDCDLVYDVRFIPNPYYINEMRPMTGNDSLVQDYVMQWDVSRKFLFKLEDMLDFLIPNYIKEGKNQLVIGIGCTGGKHRSVTLANELFSGLKNKKYRVIIHHRDIDKDNKRF